MARKLSSQEKLALALTSAGSMRELARRVGVTHQRIGRWLREGESGGVTQIPEQWRPFIDEAYSEHKALTRERAKADRIPYNADAPVYMTRRTLKSGEPGDRVVADNTEFIRSDLRRDVMQGAHDSKKFYSASVRSIVNLRSYFRRVAQKEIARTGRTDVSVKRLADIIEKDFKGDVQSKHGRTIDPAKPFPLYTRKEGLMIGRKGDRHTTRSIETKLAEKHSPSASEPGTVLADKYLFQLTPKDYAPPARKQRTGRKRKP